MDRFDDQFRAMRLACYRPIEVEQYLSKQPLGFDSKRGYELLCGCVLARCLQSLNPSATSLVGIELLTDRAEKHELKPSIDELIKYFESVDRDADISAINYYEDGNFTVTRVQVTRLNCQFTEQDPIEEMRRVLTKKMLIQPDPLLTLILMADERFSVAEETLRSLVSGKKMPYGRIGLVGQVGHAPTGWEFTYIELFPDFGTNETVSLEGFPSPPL